MSKPNALLTMTRSVEQFIEPDQMERLKSLVNLLIPDEIEKTEEAYSRLLSDLST